MAAGSPRPRAYRLARTLWELWPDANPLRRTSDRVEAWILIALCAMFLTGGPVAAVAAGRYVYDAARSAERTSHPVMAILVGNALPLEAGGQRAAAPARWTWPGSGAGLARVQVPSGARAGTTVRVWLDSGGRLTGTPMRGSGLATDVTVAAVFALAALGASLLAVAVTTRNLLRRRRLAAWEAAWRVTGPRWSRQG